ncbi:hypothetical protein BpHYR1_022544 [Brachionus plicatilis]|uniref:Uncharacterized protein n=1 Tax=Brachionus plicatilis TaxID=10195 RepID=A0A3M7QE09_BRAPC|nr:hypothetical protein BpHYR1_022544 [Brachionus plicatilis]
MVVAYQIATWKSEKKQIILIIIAVLTRHLVKLLWSGFRIWIKVGAKSQLRYKDFEPLIKIYPILNCNGYYLIQ